MTIGKTIQSELTSLGVIGNMTTSDVIGSWKNSAMHWLKCTTSKKTEVIATQQQEDTGEANMWRIEVWSSYSPWAVLIDELSQDVFDSYEEAKEQVDFFEKYRPEYKYEIFKD